MSYFIDTINRRMEHDKNVIIINTGETGSGKSSIALKIGETLNPRRFNVDRVVFSPEAFLELLNSGQLKKGDVIVFDEAGVGIPAKEWYEISNRLFNYVLQTFRQDNLILIFTTPTLGFIDGDCRKLIHYIIEARRIDYLVSQNITRIYKVEHNPRLNKNYYKVLRKHQVKVNPVRFNKPNDKLFKAYLLKKREFTNELNKNAEILMKKKKKERGQKKINPRAVKSIVLKKLDFYGKENKKGRLIVDWHLIHGHFRSKGIGENDAKFIKKEIEIEYNG